MPAVLLPAHAHHPGGGGANIAGPINTIPGTTLEQGQLDLARAVVDSVAQEEQLPESERQHVAEVVGIGAVKYADLSQHRRHVRRDLVGGRDCFDDELQRLGWLSERQQGQAEVALGVTFQGAIAKLAGQFQ